MNQQFLLRARLPKRVAPFLFPLLLSGFMTFLITGISVMRVVGVQVPLRDPLTFIQLWLHAYFPAWLIAYPILLLVTPLVRRIVNWVTRDVPAM